MKKKQNADKLKIYNASHGTERKWVLEKGNVWTRPTMSMELKSQYHRERSKKECNYMCQFLLGTVQHITRTQSL